MSRLLVKFLLASLTFAVGLETEKVFLAARALVSSLKPAAASRELELTGSAWLSAPLAQTPTEAVSPYEIKRLVDENVRAYNSQGLEEYLDLADVWARLEIDGGYFDDCAGCVEAKLFRLELDDEPGREALLKLTRGSDFCRYLIFKEERGDSPKKTKWKFLGHIDHDLNRYEMSTHRTHTDGHHHWLIIRGQSGGGTGFAAYDDTWYQVSEKGIRPVLTYTNQGNLNSIPDDVGREVRADVLNNSAAADLSRPATIEIAYSVSYTLPDDYNEYVIPSLFTKRQRVTYAWDEGQHEFVFDTAHSELPEDEFEHVYELGTLTNEDFLKYNLNELKQIANGSSVKRKARLRKFLERCAETPEKEALSRLLLQ